MLWPASAVYSNVGSFGPDVSVRGFCMMCTSKHWCAYIVLGFCLYICKVYIYFSFSFLPRLTPSLSLPLSTDSDLNYVLFFKHLRSSSERLCLAVNWSIFNECSLPRLSVEGLFVFGANLAKRCHFACCCIVFSVLLCSCFSVGFLRFRSVIHTTAEEEPLPSSYETYNVILELK